MSYEPPYTSITGVSGAERSKAERKVRIEAEEDGQTTIEVFSGSRVLSTVKVPTKELLLTVAWQTGRFLQ